MLSSVLHEDNSRSADHSNPWMILIHLLISSEGTPDFTSIFLVFLNGTWAIMHYFIIHFPSFKMEIWWMHTISSSFSQILEGIRSFVSQGQEGDLEKKKKNHGTKVTIFINSLSLHFSSDGSHQFQIPLIPFFFAFALEKSRTVGFKGRNPEISPTLDQEPRAHLLRGLKSGKTVAWLHFSLGIHLWMGVPVLLHRL